MSSSDSVETDRPINEAAEDRLGRNSFAEHAAQVLVRDTNEDSIVVGLYGPWGSGKTSVLNLIAKNLEGKPKVSVVRFNPWYFTGEIQLLEKFFEAITASLGPKSLSTRQEVVGALKKYLGVLKPTITIAGAIANTLLPGAGSATQLLTEVVTPATTGLTSIADPVTEALKREATIEDVRKRVSETLRATDTRIVILIDDIDRLYPDDIRMTFKLVRLVGDLPRVSYLLSFDPEIVAHSLDQVGTKTAQTSKGHEYLEKIIQVALPLPKARREDLRKAAFFGLASTINNHKVDLSDREAQRLQEGWTLGIERSIKTPRQIKRITNAINFAIGLLKTEVNITDLVLFEALRIAYPSLSDTIITDPQMVLSDPDPETRKPLERELAKLENHSERTGVTRLLQALFPRLNNNRSYSDSTQTQWRQEKRICSPEHLEKLLGYGIPSGIISDSMYDKMLSVLRDFSSRDDTQFSILSEQIVKNTGWSDLISRFRQDRTSLPQSAARQIALLLAERATELDQSKSTGFIANSTNATFFIYEVASGIIAPDEESKFMTEIIEASASLHFSATIIQNIEHLMSANDSGGRITEETISAARHAFTKRASTSLDISKEIENSDSESLGKLLYTWKTAAGQRATNLAFEQWFSKDPLNVNRLIAAFIPPMPQNDPYDPRTIFRTITVQNGYSNLTAILPPELIARALGCDLETPLSKELLDKVATRPHLEQVALLFIDAHQKKSQPSNQ